MRSLQKRRQGLGDLVIQIILIKIIAAKYF